MKHITLIVICQAWEKYICGQYTQYGCVPLHLTSFSSSALAFFFGLLARERGRERIYIIKSTSSLEHVDENVMIFTSSLILRKAMLAIPVVKNLFLTLPLAPLHFSFFPFFFPVSLNHSALLFAGEHYGSIRTSVVKILKISSHFSAPHCAALIVVG